MSTKKELPPRDHNGPPELIENPADRAIDRYLARFEMKQRNAVLIVIGALVITGVLKLTPGAREFLNAMLLDHLPGDFNRRF